MMQIDLDENITKNFKWREVLYCARWNVHVFPLSDVHMKNIKDVCLVLEEIRVILNSPLKITSFYRPQVYNTEAVKGSVNSYHIQGLACDFIPTSVPIDKAKLALKHFLEELNCRMEDNGKGGWIHIDLGAVGGSGRFFKP